MTALSYVEAAAYVEKVAYQIRALQFDLNAVHSLAVSPKTLRGPLVTDLELRCQIEIRRLSQILDDLRTYCIPRLKEAQAQVERNAALARTLPYGI